MIERAVMEQGLIEYLVNALWQLPLLAAGAWLLLRMVKPGPAAQHRVWLAALGLALLLPFNGIGGGAIGGGTDSGTGNVEAAPAAAVANASAQIATPGGEATSQDAFDSIGQPGGPLFGPHSLSGSNSWGRMALDAGAGLAKLVRTARVRLVRLNATSAGWIAGMYLAVALFGLFRLAQAWRAARRLVRDSQAVVLSDREQVAVTECAHRMGVRTPEVRELREAAGGGSGSVPGVVSGPVVVGAVRPVLLWPENFARDLLAKHREDELMAALCHEMAHIRRRDYMMNLLCEAATLPLKWHPAAYGVGQRIRSTREMVCDAMAAGAMESETKYAKCLLSLAQILVAGGAAALIAGSGAGSAAAGLFNGNVLEERVMRLMQGRAAMSVRVRVVRAAMGLAGMAAAIALAATFHVVPAMAQAEATAPDCSKTSVAGQVQGALSGATDDGVKTAVKCEIRDEVKNEVTTGVTSEVKDGVKSEVTTGVTSEVKDGVKNEVTTGVASEGKDGVKSEVTTAIDSGVTGGVEGGIVAGQTAPAPASAPAADDTSPSDQEAPAAPAPPAPASSQTTEPPPAPAAPVAPVAPPAPPSIAPVAPVAPVAPPPPPAPRDHVRCRDGKMIGFIDGQERELTPEERARVEAQLTEAQKKIQAEMDRFNSPEFRQQREKAQRDAEEAARRVNSAEFKEQMAKEQKQIAEAVAKVNSPEFKKQMEEAQRAAEDAARNINSAEFQEQMARAQKQVAEAAARMNSPEFKEQMEKAQRDAENAARKINSADIQKQMAEAQARLAEAMAKVKAEQDEVEKKNGAPTTAPK